MRIKRRDLMMVLDRLGLYLDAGMRMNTALNQMETGLPRRYRPVMAQVSSAIERGTPFGKALHAHFRVPSTITSLLLQGERSGALKTSLALSHSLLNREDELYKKVSSAMLYPAVILLFSLLLILGLMRGVIPQIVPMLKSLNVPLPIETKVLVYISDFLVQNWLALVISAPVGIILAGALFRTKYAGKILNGLTSALPLLRAVMYRYHLSIFFRSLGAMLNSAQNIREAYSEASGAVRESSLNRFLRRNLTRVAEGATISSILYANRNIPKYLGAMVETGEKTGTLPRSLERCADILDRELEASLKKMTVIIEPILMVGMGGVVGGIALSIILPIYDISKSIQT